MKKIIRIIMSIIVLVSLIAFFYFITNNITKYTGLFISEEILNKENKLDDCIKENNIEIFINSQESKIAIDTLKLTSFNNIKIFNCNNNEEYCNFRNIKVYPTFNINGKNLEENLDDYRLTNLLGCS